MRPSETLTALDAIRRGGRAADFESETLDFKQEKTGSVDDTLKDLADAALCFANARGGMIVLGVSDKERGAAAFLGTTLAPSDVTRRIHQLTNPPLLVAVDEHIEGGSRLLLIRVPESPDVHADRRGRASVRMGTSCEPLGPADFSRLREAKSGFDWSGRAGSRSRADVAAEALATARKSLALLSDDRRKLSRSDDGALLAALGLVAGTTDRLNRAGEVLLCAPEGGVSSPAIVYQYRATPGGDPKDVQRIEAPLVLAVQRVLEIITARRSLTPLTLPSGQQLDVADFPEGAVREALINAVVHRDYTSRGPVVVDHSPEVLVISSPGPLVMGVTLENMLTHPSAPRNPALAKAMRTLGYAEEVGRGIDRIYREMIRAGRSLPVFEASVDQVRVSLVGGAPNTRVARFIAGLPEEERDDTDAMLILFRLCTQRSIDATQAAPLLQKTTEETEAVLRRLSTERVGLLESTRQTARRAKPTYRFRGEVLRGLGQAVTYQRRTVDEIDRKVIAHVREYGTVTNKTLQNLFDVGIPRARDILRDLVEREILVKQSEHERGPGVEYGKGRRFPTTSRPRRAPESS